MGKPSSVFSGRQYRIQRKKIEVYVKCGKCKGKLRTNVQYEILSKTDHSCVPKLAKIEVKIKLDSCRKKREREDMSVPVRAVYKEDLSFTFGN
jgi:hypothetical protein